MRLFLAMFLFMMATEATVYSCDNEIQKMLNCLEEKFNDPGKSAILADEYANDLKTSIKETLRKHPAQVTSACTLNPDSFDGDFFGPRGPMAGSPMLTVAAAYLRDLLFNVSSSSKNANAGLCLKKTLAESLLDEIKPCVAAKMGILDMKFPKMPVFDENLIKKQDALKTTVYRAMVHNKLHECHQDSSKKAHYSENLFNVKSNKFFRKHCDAVSVCSSGMGNWRTKLRNAVDACIKDQGEEEHPFAFIADDTAVEAACDQLATITDEKRHKVLDAVQAFHSFLASINDSFIRFCHVEC